MAEISKNDGTKGTKNGDGRGRKKAFTLPHNGKLTLAEVIRRGDVFAKTAGNVRAKYSGVTGSVRDGAFTVTASGMVVLATMQRTPLERTLSGPLSDMQTNADIALAYLRPVEGGGIVRAAAESVDEAAALESLMGELGIEADEDSNIDEDDDNGADSDKE